MPDDSYNPFDAFVDALDFSDFGNLGELPPIDPVKNTSDVLFKEAVDAYNLGEFERLSSEELRQITPAILYSCILRDWLKEAPAVGLPPIESLIGGSDFYERMKDTFKVSISNKEFIMPIMASHGFPDVAALHPEVDNNGIRMALELVEDHIARVLMARVCNYNEEKFVEYMQEFNREKGSSQFLPIRNLELPRSVSGTVEFREEVLPTCKEIFDIDTNPIVRSSKQLGGYAGFVFALEFYCFMSDYYQEPGSD